MISCFSPVPLRLGAAEGPAARPMHITDFIAIGKMLRSIHHCCPKNRPDHRTREKESESTMATISTRVLLIGLALLCGACSTDLKVKRLQTGSHDPERGWIYSLPYVRYKVSI